MKNHEYLKGAPSCGVSKTLRIIGKKWTTLILYSLLGGTKRFGQLQKVLGEISPRTLSLRLKELEDDGLVRKQVFPEVPLHVEYSLTQKGTSLSAIIDTMQQWGNNH